MSPSGAEVIRQIKQQVAGGRPGRGLRAPRQRRDPRRRARVGGVGPRAHPRRGARAARISRVAHRGRGLRPRRPGGPLLRLGPALGARRPHADRAARVHQRALDDRRHHALEGPRLQGRGPEGAHAEQKERYGRHILLPEVGAEGQAKLLDAKVLLLGAGGLGRADRALPRRRRRGDARDRRRRRRRPLQPAAPGDPLDEDIGTPKVDSAEATINALNPDVKVVKYPVRLDSSNIMEIIEGYDVIVDGVDNFPTRYLLNDATVRLGIPVVSASILGFDGQLSVFAPHDGPVLPLPVPRAAAGRARARPAAPTASSACCPGRWACCRRPRSSSS